MNVGIDPSKVVITKLKIDKDRKAILERKSVSVLHHFPTCNVHAVVKLHRPPTRRLPPSAALQIFAVLPAYIVYVHAPHVCPALFVRCRRMLGRTRASSQRVRCR